MTLILFRYVSVPRLGKLTRRAAVLFVTSLVATVVCYKQDSTEKTPTQRLATAGYPLRTDERAELPKLIRSLQERVEKFGCSIPALAL